MPHLCSSFTDLESYAILNVAVPILRASHNSKATDVTIFGVKQALPPSRLFVSWKAVLAMLRPWLLPARTQSNLRDKATSLINAGCLTYSMYVANRAGQARSEADVAREFGEIKARWLAAEQYLPQTYFEALGPVALRAAKPSMRSQPSPFAHGLGSQQAPPTSSAEAFNGVCPYLLVP